MLRTFNKTMSLQMFNHVISQYLKPSNRERSVTVWTIATKFGTFTHVAPINFTMPPIYRLVKTHFCHFVVCSLLSYSVITNEMHGCCEYDWNSRNLIADSFSARSSSSMRSESTLSFSRSWMNLESRRNENCSWYFSMLQRTQQADSCLVLIDSFAPYWLPPSQDETTKSVSGRNDAVGL